MPEDWEYPEPDEDEDEDETETRDCPACGTAVYEDAEQCPVCGEYILSSGRGPFRWPGWLVAAGLIGIGMVTIAGLVQTAVIMLRGMQ